MRKFLVGLAFALGLTPMVALMPTVAYAQTAVSAAPVTPCKVQTATGIVCYTGHGAGVFIGFYNMALIPQTVSITCVDQFGNIIFQAATLGASQSLTGPAPTAFGPALVVTCTASGAPASPGIWVYIQ